MIKALPILLLAVAVAVLISTNSPQKNIVAESGACVNQQSLSQATGLFESGATLAYYNNQKIPYPSDLLAKKDTNANVLAAYDSAGKEKWIEVNLGEQTLTAWEGNQIFLKFPISSGLWSPTPPGTYNIYWKLRYIRMTGGDKTKGDFYDLPNVPDTMFFYQGYGIHGAYWHNNFGHPMSHGCVNEPLQQAHILFEWAGPRINPDQSSVRASADNPGSRVYIH